MTSFLQGSEDESGATRRRQGDSGLSLAAHWGVSLSQSGRERPARASSEESDIDNACKYKQQTKLLIAFSDGSHDPPNVPQAILLNRLQKRV